MDRLLHFRQLVLPLRIAIVQDAKNPRENRLSPLLTVLFWMPLSSAPDQSVGLPEYNPILRC
jgi:hypothetical protein